MIVCKYGITLIPLTREKIELVRQWRNSLHVRKFMRFRENITEAMQSQWFDSIQNEHNKYVIIQFEGEMIGMSNVKNIDLKNRSAEGGFFIAKQKYINSDIPVRANLCALDWCFENLKLNTIYATVLSYNKRAQKFNEAFGYTMLQKEENNDFQTYMLTKKEYYKHKPKLINLLWN